MKADEMMVYESGVVDQNLSDIMRTTRDFIKTALRRKGGVYFAAKPGHRLIIKIGWKKEPIRQEEYYEGAD